MAVGEEKLAQKMPCAQARRRRMQLCLEGRHGGLPWLVLKAGLLRAFTLFCTPVVHMLRFWFGYVHAWTSYTLRQAGLAGTGDNEGDESSARILSISVDT